MFKGGNIFKNLNKAVTKQPQDEKRGEMPLEECLTQAQSAIHLLSSLGPADSNAFPTLNESTRLGRHTHPVRYADEAHMSHRCGHRSATARRRSGEDAAQRSSGPVANVGALVPPCGSLHTCVDQSSPAGSWTTCSRSCGP
jgi:hypothetical protein